MQQRRLGRAGPLVSALGLGCAGLALGPGGPVSEAEATALIAAAIGRGITLFDTAAMYGVSEALLGRALRGRRDGLVIATKFGVLVDNAGRPVGTDGSPAAAAQSCEASLRALGAEAIDLLYLHRLDRAVPIEETVGGMARLVEAGKVRHLGLSEVSAATLARAVAVHPIAVLQTEYSLWSREVEAEVLPACRRLGVGFVPYSPLGRGFLARGQVHNLVGGAMPRLEGENLARNRALADALAGFAAARGVTAAQVALAWLLAQGDDVVPIPGTRRIAAVEENCGAVTLCLDAAALAELSQVFAPDRVAGDRLSETARRFADR